MSAQLPLDLTVARAARDRGIALSTAANALWMLSAMEWLRSFATVRETFTMEQFRHECAALKRDEPTSPNAWGAFTTAATKAGVMEWTQRYVSAASKKTHAHPVKLWKSLCYRRAA